MVSSSSFVDLSVQFGGDWLSESNIYSSFIIIDAK